MRIKELSQLENLALRAIFYAHKISAHIYWVFLRSESISKAMKLK